MSELREKLLSNIDQSFVDYLKITEPNEKDFLALTSTINGTISAMESDDNNLILRLKDISNRLEMFYGLNYKNISQEIKEIHIDFLSLKNE